MNPGALKHLRYAKTIHAEIEKLRGIGLHGLAGREAYLVAFHAAQAYVIAKTGNAPKTHAGLHAEFTRLTALSGDLSPEFAGHLSRSYILKAAHDYMRGETLTPEQIAERCDLSGAFMLQVAERLGVDMATLPPFEGTTP
ncbi:HEPN domain-containing protein [Ferrovibrio sp.]|uniref:HEPN domain-containing protein n=1 Tax=Ferrovibrio sp. TaxID=1917215 RepID=UPI0035B22F73